MSMNHLCPLDGRYQAQTQTLRQVMGEEAFAAARVRVECAWLLQLASARLFTLTPAQKKILSSLPCLSKEDFQLLTQLEQTGYKDIPATHHDVKAVEYFLRIRLGKTSLRRYLNWIHFALTSEDVNSVAYALLLADGLEKGIIPLLENIRKQLAVLAKKEARSVLLARTHGQPAVPTTFGKEIRVFENRLAGQLDQLKKQRLTCKFGGAVGNYNAHYAAFAHINWPRLSAQLIQTLGKGHSIKIKLSPVCTQIDNRDSYAEIFDNLRRIHIILLGFSQDMWQYISAGLVRQKVVTGEVGSSTMPQKVNPIDFENAEGNLKLANALLSLFSEKLPLSRLQRDLSDSTVLRNMGVALGYAGVAYASLLKGLQKISFDKVAAKEELRNHPEILTESFQTILRAHGCADAYEQLKAFARGRKLTTALLVEFIEKLKVGKDVKTRLKNITVENYWGIAPQLAEGKYD